YSAHYLFAVVLVIWFTAFFLIDLFMVFRLRRLAFAHAEAASDLKGRLVDSASNIETVHQQAEEPYEHRVVGQSVADHKIAHRKSWFMFEWILVANGVLLAIFTLGMV